jgi:hypothetical protein
MRDILRWQYWMWWAIFASPALPIAYAWRRLRRSPRMATVVDVVPLAVASLSSLWFDAVVANWNFLGPLYSRLHYIIIAGNTAAVFLSAIVALISSASPSARAQRLAACIACLMLAMEWAIIGVINR